MSQKPTHPTGEMGTTRNVSDETVLKIAKEIAVKFIEVGRLTPSTFDETFKSIHRTIEQSVSDND